MSGVYLMQEGGKMTEMTELPYDSEDLLQRLLAEHPNLLAGDQIDPVSPRRWMLVRREVPVASAEDGAGRWALDHLFLDQDGVPTFVEVKRSSNREIRRTIVGQMLDYAANAVAYWPTESIQEWHERASQSQGRDGEQALHDFLGEDADLAAFWKSVNANLRAGRVRLVFVADEVPPELRRVVEFLNEQMETAEAFAVEIRQFSSGASRALVPRVFGQAEKSHVSTSGSTQWDADRFFKKLQEIASSEEVVVARRLLDWGISEDRFVYWGRGTVDGKFVPQILHGGRYYQMFHVGTSRRMTIPFQAYKYPFDTQTRRREVLARLNSVLTNKIPEAALDRYPSFALGELTGEGKLDQFLQVYDWFIREVKGAPALSSSEAQSA